MIIIIIISVNVIIKKCAALVGYIKGYMTRFYQICTGQVWNGENFLIRQLVCMRDKTMH